MRYEFFLKFISNAELPRSNCEGWWYSLNLLHYEEWRRTLKWVNKRNPYPVLNIHRKLPVENLEEGGDDVKSARPLCLGLHTSYNGYITASLQYGNVKLISQKYPQFRLRAAIRPHEVEIASNRGSAGRGEYVLGSCTN